MLLIGNPTNIYLGTINGIDFISYFKVMALPTLAGGIVELGLLFLIFSKLLKQPIQNNEEIYRFDDKIPVIFGLINLFTCLIFLILSSYLHFEMWLISLICASTFVAFILVYSIFKKSNSIHVKAAFTRLPYQLIPFFLSMFVIVVALNVQGISGELAKWLGSNNSIWVYGYSSFLASNLINNIPMSILFADLTISLSGTAHLQAVYASIIGSNIGAFLTPIGALAGIMFTNLVGKNDVKFSFLDFIKYGSIISIPVISVILAMTLLIL